MKEKRSLFSAIPLGLICGIVAAVLFYFALGKLNYNEYQAKSKIITTSLDKAEKDTEEAKVYAATINSNKIKKTVLENLGLDMSLGMLDTKLRIEPIEGSPVIDLVVTDTNKLRAEDLADEYADLSVRVIKNIYGKDAQVMEYAYGSAGKVNNGYVYSAIVGGAVFVLVSLIGMIRVNSFNNKLLKLAVERGDFLEEAREIPKKERMMSFKKKDEEVLDNSYENEPEERQDEPEDYEEDLTAYETTKFTAIDEDDDDLGETTIINKEDIILASNDKELCEEASDDIEVLGKLPPYSRGELDV